MRGPGADESFMVRCRKQLEREKPGREGNKVFNWKCVVVRYPMELCRRRSRTSKRSYKNPKYDIGYILFCKRIRTIPNSRCAHSLETESSK